ncbi:MAG TPA: glycoside hydrolase family 15 protein [Myxococcota bacterium]|jgi:GH15 family glucan-1,4-alpha-glucosidase|nr:glycoside hydrolase family 15 protein [Myxococcota bacterium]
MRLEDLGLIGNCQFSALVASTGEVVWCCLPQPDSEPVFAVLLDAAGGGRFLVGPAEGGAGVQTYLGHTNVLETRFRAADGAFRVLDFAPRFLQHGRPFRPTQLWRVIEPLEGTPRIRIVCEPVLGWSRAAPMRLQGSNHFTFGGFASELRLTADTPLSCLNGRPFTLTQRRHLALTWGPAVEEPLDLLADRFLGETVRYWQRWVKHCNVPSAFQREVIRSALALKLHCFEDTGAIVAATTTSLPESPGSGRTWDYRFCWLRDAYYALGAFRLLGHFEERERFVTYLIDIAARHPTLDLAPLYCIDGDVAPPERILEAWPGFEGERPVRVGNGAALHRQNDIYGEMVLALAPVFLDERFEEERSPSVLALLEGLAQKAVSVVGTPDAGIWEYRTAWQPQTFSSLMSWAAADRMAVIAARHAPARAGDYRAAADQIRARILAESWNEGLRGFAATPGGTDLDASLLQMAALRLLPAEDPRLAQSVDAIRAGLTHDGWLQRYRLDDGFGPPTAAFLICTFWLVEALAVTGRRGEARAVLEQAQSILSPLGLLSEDYHPAGRRLCGNFPQAYSHVGLIHAAFRASPGWGDVL